MRVSRVVLAGAAGLSLVALSAATAVSGDDDHEFRAKLIGYQEVPSVSTPARGWFKADVHDDEITFTLNYGGLSAPVQQAHIHFGQAGVNGGISVFLCTNLGNAPAGVPTPPPCPQSGELTGTLTAASVGGPDAQGIAPGEMTELLRAVKAGVGYVNVHSEKFPGGEIRGKLRVHD